jgi:hypothetical protein
MGEIGYRAHSIWVGRSNKAVHLPGLAVVALGALLSRCG